MGTRADFYIGRGEQAEWLGSIAWDGYPGGVDSSVFTAATEGDYRAAVDAFLDPRDDKTLPSDGWPWPWETSRTTDYAYAFDGGVVYASCFGSKWFDPKNEPEEIEDSDRERAVFPNMKDRKQRKKFGPHSGLIVIG